MQSSQSALCRSDDPDRPKKAYPQAEECPSSSAAMAGSLYNTVPARITVFLADFLFLPECLLGKLRDLAICIRKGLGSSGNSHISRLCKQRKICTDYLRIVCPAYFHPAHPVPGFFIEASDIGPAGIPVPFSPVLSSMNLIALRISWAAYSCTPSSVWRSGAAIWKTGIPFSANLLA